ncbi:hypothetical protein BDQ17DRAFT_1434821 [Cyathus striatus]|nr:hypothetical protein BDQ17DRAFT_1434821 [Cyathus striatus]
MLLDDTATVNDIVNFDVPQQSSDLLLCKPGSEWYIKNSPTSDPKLLFQYPIPSAEQLSQLRNAYGPAWFEGCQSLVDQHFGGAECFPVWVLTLWSEMVRIRDGQSTWKQSICWCIDESERCQKRGDSVTVALLETVHERLFKLPWNACMDFENGNTHTIELATYLGTWWLADDHINMMVKVLSEELAKKEQESRYVESQRAIIAPLTFSYDIMNINRKLQLSAKHFDHTVIKQYQ